MCDDYITSVDCNTSWFILAQFISKNKCSREIELHDDDYYRPTHAHTKSINSCPSFCYFLLPSQLTNFRHFSLIWLDAITTTAQQQHREKNIYKSYLASAARPTNNLLMSCCWTRWPCRESLQGLPPLNLILYVWVCLYYARSIYL